MNAKRRIIEAWRTLSPNKAQAVTSYLIFNYGMNEGEITRMLHVLGVPVFDWRDLLVDMADSPRMNWREMFEKAEKERANV